MSSHEPKHREWLERLAVGELSGDSEEFRALDRCADCQAEARDLREVSERLAAVDRERRAILSEVEESIEDPSLQSRVDRALSPLPPWRRHERRARRWWLGLVAASLTIALGIYAVKRDGPPRKEEDGRGHSLGGQEQALAAPRLVRTDDGGLRVIASRSPQTGCRLVFEFDDPANGQSLFSPCTVEATITVPAATMADWPDTVTVLVIERSEGDVDMGVSKSTSWSRSAH